MLPADTPQEKEEDRPPPSPPPPPPPLPLPSPSEVRLGPKSEKLSDMRLADSPLATAVVSPPSREKSPPRAQPVRSGIQSERYEVTFALPGALGMEFAEIEPPYRISRVHAGSIAEKLGVRPGDCMRAIDANVLTEEKVEWESIRQMLSKRPVVAQFERGLPEEAGDGPRIGGVVGNWGVGVLTSAISNVKTATHAAIATGIGSAARRAEDGGRTPEDRSLVESLQAQVAQLQKQLAERPLVELPQERSGSRDDGGDDSFSTLADAYASLQQQHSSLLAQFDAMQQMQSHAEEVERYKARVEQLKEEKRALEGAVRDLGNLDTLKDRLRKGMEAEVNAADQARQVMPRTYL